MKFALKHNLSENDIPVANITTKRIRSEHIMNITDYSTHVSDNTISILRETISGISDSDPELGGMILNKYNIFNSILLTNEYSYSLEMGTKIPLYFSHRINNNIYTKNVSRKSIRKKISSEYFDNERKIKGMIPRNGKYIIPVNSISVSKVISPTILDPRNYFMDYGSGELTIVGTIAKGETYLITYLLVEDKYTVTDDNDFIYRISLEKLYPGSDNYFSMNILSTTQSPLMVKYMSAESNGRAREYTSYTIGEPIFTEITEEIRQSVITNNLTELKVYSREVLELVPGVTKEFILLPFGSVYDTYTFKSDSRDTSIVKMKQIPNIDYNHNWYIEITTGMFWSEDNTGQYWQPDNKTRVRKIKDEPLRINQTILSLTRNNPIISIDEYGRPAGITIKSEDGTIHPITKVDVQKSTVYLTNPVRMSDKLYAEYYIKNNTIEYEKVSFNPIVQNIEFDNDISQYLVVLLMAPYQHTNINGINRYIYHLALPKYAKEGVKNYSYDDIYELVNGDENLRDKIEGLPASVTDDELVILGSVYLSNCLDEDGYLLEDARTYGGGKYSQNSNFFDMSFYDGEKTDLNTILHIFIKQKIYDDLYSRVLIYDRETRLYQDDAVKMSQVAKQRTYAIINKKIEKFVPIGMEWEVVIG